MTISKLNEQGWTEYKIQEMNLKQTEEIEKKCSSEAFWARAKSIGMGAIAILGTLALALVSFKVAEVAALIFGLVLLPLIIVPPLYLSLVIILAVGAAGAFGFFSIRAVWEKVMGSAINLWKEANHYQTQTDLCQDRKIALIR